MKKYLIASIIAALVALVLGISFLYKENKKLQKDLSVSISNEKAFIAENSGLKNDNRAFQFTIEQLNYYNDSLLQEMNKVRKELKVKDKDLKQIQYISSVVTKTDTVVFRDTLFKEVTLDIDTILGDKWYQMGLGLKYPNTITTAPKFISEKYIVVNYKKETINPPKKCWLVRLFQKKHKVLEVDVLEKNPYIENDKQKFVEILK